MTNFPHVTVGTASVPLTLMSTTTLQECVDDYLASRRWAKDTRKHSTYTLNGFVLATGNPPITELSHDHVAAWWATRRTLAPSTARSRRSTIANFLQWCRHTDRMAHDPLAGIPIPREPRRVPATLTDEDYASLERHVPDHRGAAIIALMYWLGLRCVDVANLQVHDADLRRETLIITGKAENEDVLPLPTSCTAALRRYLGRHPAPAGPLFRTYTNPQRPMSAQLISDLVGKWLRDAGVKRAAYDGLGAHALRRTCATDLLDSGANLRQVQAVMRHESLATTQRYLRRADAEELRSVLERKPPNRRS